jgi:hypothetical protein
MQSTFSRLTKARWRSYTPGRPDKDTRWFLIGDQRGPECLPVDQQSSAHTAERCCLTKCRSVRHAEDSGRSLAPKPLLQTRSLQSLSPTVMTGQRT